MFNVLKAASNPIKAAKDELLKLDFDKDKVPDVIEALDAAEVGCDALADFVDNIQFDEAVGVLKALNGFRNSANQKSQAQIEAAAAGLVAIPGAIRKLKELLEKAEAELKK
jgi:hypothetical protein